MARQLRIQYPGAYYHVTCRGNERKEIYRGHEDYQVFQEKLTHSLEIYQVRLLSYVCMRNHFHLLVQTPLGNLSEFMRHFNITYTSWFNRRHSRVGHLYQGRYKAFLIDADNYLLAVSRYIHLNPVRTKAFENMGANETWNALLEFQNSSLHGFLDAGQKDDFVDYEKVLGQIGGTNKVGRARYRRFISQGIDKERENPLEIGRGVGIIGEKSFVEFIKARFPKSSLAREQPELRALQNNATPDSVVSAVSNMLNIPKEALCRKGKNAIERAMLMEALYRFCGISQKKIGEVVGGIDYSAVSQARKRLRDRINKDKTVRRRFEYIAASLSEDL